MGLDNNGIQLFLVHLGIILAALEDEKIYNIYKAHEGRIKKDGIVQLRWASDQVAHNSHDIEDIKNEIGGAAIFRFGRCLNTLRLKCYFAFQRDANWAV